MNETQAEKMAREAWEIIDDLAAYEEREEIKIPTKIRQNIIVGFFNLFLEKGLQYKDGPYREKLLSLSKSEMAGLADPAAFPKIFDF